MITVVIVSGNVASGQFVLAELRRSRGCAVACLLDGFRPCARSVALAAPDIVVFDAMPAPHPLLACVSDIREAAPRAKLLLLAARMDGPGLAMAVHAGIDAAIARHSDAGSLTTLVREIALGNVYHSVSAASADGQLTSDPLTRRELQILRMVAAGASNARIARHLWVAEGTVKYHLSNVYRKLGVTNRTEASHYAHLHRWLEPADPLRRVQEDAA
jgi:DNA-binding NarL/FixJ family response regulator